VRKTTITIDDEKLEAVQEALGTSGITETVDRALRAVLAAEARRREVERLTTMRGIDLDDPEVMARAWRG
jgi:Arc/MetJ family transcription regulator